MTLTYAIPTRLCETYETTPTKHEQTAARVVTAVWGLVAKEFQGGHEVALWRASPTAETSQTLADSHTITDPLIKITPRKFRIGKAGGKRN